MRFLSTLVKVSGLLTVLLSMSSSHAEINHTNKDLNSSSGTQTKENGVYDPSVQPGALATVAYRGDNNLTFGVDFYDHSSSVEILRMSPLESPDNVELNAGFTYTGPNHNNAKFYMNYTMLGGSERPVLEDKSSDQAYYIDQRAKVGVKIAF